jgi:hypothetical protein
MNAGDLETIRGLIQTAPLNPEIRAIIADHFAYSLQASHPRLVRDPYSFKRRCARQIAGESHPAGTPQGDTAEAERRAFGIKL